MKKAVKSFLKIVLSAVGAALIIIGASGHSRKQEKYP